MQVGTNVAEDEGNEPGSSVSLDTGNMQNDEKDTSYDVPSRSVSQRKELEVLKDGRKETSLGKGSVPPSTVKEDLETKVIISPDKVH